MARDPTTTAPVSTQARTCRETATCGGSYHDARSFQQPPTSATRAESAHINHSGAGTTDHADRLSLVPDRRECAHRRGEDRLRGASGSIELTGSRSHVIRPWRRRTAPGLGWPPSLTAQEPAPAEVGG